ncbi:MAG: hypothetical protein AAGF66_15435 [Cyanobacteria bacterium P01_H01_bin.119]
MAKPLSFQLSAILHAIALTITLYYFAGSLGLASRKTVPVFNQLADIQLQQELTPSKATLQR